MEPEAELLEPVRGLGPPGQRTVYATAGRPAAAAAVVYALGRTVSGGTVTGCGGRGRGHGAPVPHRRHGRGQRQLELGKVGAPVTQRTGGHARVVGTGRVAVVLARHARRPADVHQSGLLVVRGHAAVGNGGRGGTFARDLAGHALGRRRVIRTTGDGAPARSVLQRCVVVVASRRVRRTGPPPMLRVGRPGVFPIVAVGRRRRRRFVLVQARYARRLFGQASVHYVLQHVLLLAAAAVAVAVGRRTHRQVTGKQVTLGFHHPTVDRFHGHVVALFVGSAIAAAAAAAATALLMTALVARVCQSVGFGQHVFGVFVVAKRFAKLQVHVVRVRRRFSAVLGCRRLLLFTVDAGWFQVHVVTRGRGRQRFRVLLFLRHVHGRVNRSVGLAIVLQKSHNRLSRRKYLL